MSRNPQPPSAPRPQRLSGDARSRMSFSNGDMSAQPAPFTNGQARQNGPFDMARSPPGPNNKGTKHVPCKFYRQGTCQAGNACPFLHSNDVANEPAVCKYFSKGNCRFGAKCALQHILPDGRRVPRAGPGSSGGLNIGGRVNPPPYQHHSSVLANSLLNQPQYLVDPVTGQYIYPPEDLGLAQEYDERYTPYAGESAFASRTGSKYGSPNEGHLPMSGVERRLTALDAPMPASFDSNGISHIARYGAVAASVPSKFQMESPPASLPHRTAQPDAVKALRTSLLPSNLRNSSRFGSSPPTVETEDPSQRKLHSQHPIQRPRVLSSSVPRPGTRDEWTEGFAIEEDYLPPTLHDDVLTPQEKMRRLSRPETDFNTFRNSTSSGLGIPSANSSKVGSPMGMGTSPSRFSALFASQKREASASGQQGSTAGPVGSPLRESHMNNAQTASSGAFGDGITARPSSSRTRPPGLGDIASPASITNPPRSASGSVGMSLISSQLDRVHLSPHPDGGDSSRLHPSNTTTNTRHVSAPEPARHSTGPMPTSATSAASAGTGLSSPCVHSTRISEEGDDLGGVFSMDDDISRRAWGGKSPVISPNQLAHVSINTGGAPGGEPKVVGLGHPAIGQGQGQGQGGIRGLKMPIFGTIGAEKAIKSPAPTDGNEGGNGRNTPGTI